MSALYVSSLDTPLGSMEIQADNRAVRSIHFVEHAAASQPNEISERARLQLEQYFAGDREQFDLPLAPQGTDFQQSVWRALTTVPYGKTCSYSAIAEKIQNPKAVRAVGAANGRNPLTIVVPCHRVIGNNGTLTGYASGVDRKAWLLQHEANTLF